MADDGGMARLSSFFAALRGPARPLLLPGEPVEVGRLMLRLAVPGDEEALEALAALDRERAPRGLVLLAEVSGRAWAALSLDDGHAVTHPSHPGAADLVLRLADHGRALLRGTRGRRHELPSVWPPQSGSL
jgi:hypothetical protein